MMNLALFVLSMLVNIWAVVKVYNLAKENGELSAKLRTEKRTNELLGQRLLGAKDAVDSVKAEVRKLESANEAYGERIAELEAANEKLITERAKIRQAVGVELPGIDVPEGPKFAVGDKVVVVCGHDHDDYFPTGTIATVCQIDSVEPAIGVTNKDEHFTWVYTSDIELAPSEVDAVEGPYEVPVFGVGDKAVVVGGDRYHFFKVGTTVTIERSYDDPSGSLIYMCRNGGHRQGVKPQHLEHAPSEVSK